MITVFGFLFLFLAVFFMTAGIMNDNDKFLITVSLGFTAVGAIMVSVSQ